MSCDRDCAKFYGNQWEEPHIQTRRFCRVGPGKVGEQDAGQTKVQVQRLGSKREDLPTGHRIGVMIVVSYESG